MTFQFMCPQGHLLEGDASQAGQTCDCPMCGTRFIIPQPHGGPQDQGGPEQGGGTFDFGGGAARSGDPFASVVAATSSDDPFAGVGIMGGAAQAEANPFDESGPRLVHIPCPSGHALETTYDMIGQDVLCPFCGQQFQLRYKDSVEYKKERAEERERRDKKVGDLWFKWAIAIAVLVLVGVIVLIAVAMMPKAPNGATGQVDTATPRIAAAGVERPHHPTGPVPVETGLATSRRPGPAALVSKPLSTGAGPVGIASDRDRWSFRRRHYARRRCLGVRPGDGDDLSRSR